jgi:hypothetical protein
VLPGLPRRVPGAGCRIRPTRSSSVGCSGAILPPPAVSLVVVSGGELVADDGDDPHSLACAGLPPSRVPPATASVACRRAVVCSTVDQRRD